MPHPERRWAGWRAIALVAITYIYFLIFAQFAFLKRLADLGLDPHLKIVMTAMAAGGILFSLLAPRTGLLRSPRLRLSAGLAVCAIAAELTTLPLGLAASIAASFLIGAGLGLLTVTLVTYLPLWLGSGRPLLQVGLGTGIGYLACNFPPFFTASPHAQAMTASLLCAIGIVPALAGDGDPSLTLTMPPGLQARTPPTSSFSFARALACFTALVWLDSAAFFIIQNTPALKAGTWEGSLHLWSNALLHLAAALASAWILRRHGVRRVLALAFSALAAACLLLLSPGRVLLASAFYPLGVSLYSVALVAYPSLLAPAASVAEKGRQAGWIYAIAGWFGSAMGIGMGQNLGHVPPAFVAFAGAVIFFPEVMVHLRSRWRESAAVCVTATVALVFAAATRQTSGPQTPPDAVARGRKVYIGEGCINCHSQYVRPQTADELLWGPSESLEQLRRDHPPLIGNRRQGPDLSAVGARRSALWMRAHFYDPPAVSYASFMPSYAYLFHDGRGEDLIAYLKSLRGDGTAQHLALENAWHLSPSTLASADAPGSQGALLYQRNCATCHQPNGPTRERWTSSFRRLPPDLGKGPFAYLPPSASEALLRDRLAHMIKFGIPGTDMAGHEYLPDEEVAVLTNWLTRRVQPALQERSKSIPNGDRP